jgi:hypothetical protein
VRSFGVGEAEWEGLEGIVVGCWRVDMNEMCIISRQTCIFVGGRDVNILYIDYQLTQASVTIHRFRTSDQRYDLITARETETYIFCVSERSQGREIISRRRFSVFPQWADPLQPSNVNHPRVSLPSLHPSIAQGQHRSQGLIVGLAGVQPTMSVWPCLRRFAGFLLHVHFLHYSRDPYVHG